jgi:hypothetical protein
MKTTSYNPSPLEIEWANALSKIPSEIEKHLSGNRIVQAICDLTQDNPAVKIQLVDPEGDHPDVVVRIVQLPDKP